MLGWSPLAGRLLTLNSQGSLSAPVSSVVRGFELGPVQPLCSGFSPALLAFSHSDRPALAAGSRNKHLVLASFMALLSF